MSEATTAAAKTSFVSTRNACKLCAPLGASFAYLGVEGTVPLLHGSQGCSTYIRRYGISHFREPIDIASSNFTESAAIFGGELNLGMALNNVSRQYGPKAIGVASTCLSETIGENVPMYLARYRSDRAKDSEAAAAEGKPAETEPVVFYASTPSYAGTHMEGFHAAVRAVVEALVPAESEAPRGQRKPPAESGDAVAPAEIPSVKPGSNADSRINLLSGFVSTEDIRELHEILESFRVPYTLLPDYSETLDGVSWDEYRKLPEGGTPLDSIRAMGSAARTVALGTDVSGDRDAGVWLAETRGVPLTRIPLPIGVENADRFFATLSEAAGTPIPDRWLKARGRLVDAYIDGHKYLAGKKAILYGENDFVSAVGSFLAEIGVKVALSGGPEADFAAMAEQARDLGADFAMGNSKGLFLARKLQIPLVRCGFPIHDRIGGQRIRHLGYRGTMNLFDLVCNTLMEARQDAAGIGYTYI